jgi:predicted ester cyclase
VETVRFPDLRFTVEDQIAEGEKVVARGTLRGTHRGEFLGIAPTGKQATQPSPMKDIGLRFAR